MQHSNQPKKQDHYQNRRSFLYSTACIGAAAVGLPRLNALSGIRGEQESKPFDPDSVKTNIESALAAPRSEYSLPGLYPGVVSEIHCSKAVDGIRPDAEVAAAMLDAGMTRLTDAADVREAWAQFFSPSDRVGIKINPAHGKMLSNTFALTGAIIAGLESVGVKRSNMMIWDRFEDMLTWADYTNDSFPGVKVYGNGYMVKENGKDVRKGEERLDKDVFYEFDVYGELNLEDPLMIHGGLKSYYTKIVTQTVDKIINVAVLKNASTSITLCMKNISYGATSNTRRAHKIWHRFIAEATAFPPIRDKTVLNIIDGLRACYEGGPVPPAHYIWNANSIWIGTDIVAVDRIAWETIFAKRVEKGIAGEQDREQRDKYLDQLVRAEKLGLGVYDGEKIDWRKVSLG